MVEPERIIERHEAGGLTSVRDYQLFLDWQKKQPGYTWNRAWVNRYEGLTLYYDQDESTTIELHFAHANCGYRGQGPDATCDILLAAGFGLTNPEVLTESVYTHEDYRFTRSM